MSIDPEPWELLLEIRSAMFWSIRHRFAARFPNSDDDRLRVSLIDIHTSRSKVNALLDVLDLDEVEISILESIHTDFDRAGFDTPFGSAHLRDPLGRIFADLVDISSNLYRRHGGLANKPALIVEQSEHDASGFHVKGGVSNRGELVSLRISVDDYDWNTFSAIPGVLLHELICHVFAGHSDAGTQEFGEGFMDRVSIMVLDLVAETGLLGFPSARLKRVSRLLRSHRSSPFHEVGEYALEATQAVIASSPRLGLRSPGVLTLRLALALNASMADIEAKDSLVRRLGSHRSAELGPIPELVEAAAFAAEGDLDQAVADLLAK